MEDSGGWLGKFPGDESVCVESSGGWRWKVRVVGDGKFG